MMMIIIKHTFDTAFKNKHPTFYQSFETFDTISPVEVIIIAYLQKF